MATFPIRIARRYLLSKKSNNVINIISLISGIGVTIGTAAIICVLSVFNGFEGLISNMFSALDPDLKIELVEGKTVNASLPSLHSVQQLDNIAVYCEVFEENALLQFKDKQVAARIKGVDENYHQLARADSIIVYGQFVFKNGDVNFGVMGIGLAEMLGASTTALYPLYIYAPQRTVTTAQIMTNPSRAFRKMNISLGGIFMLNQPEYDQKYLMVDKALAQDLFESKGLISSVELKVKNENEVEQTKKKVQTLLGSSFKVLDRQEQQQDFFKMMKIEKWFSYLLLSFILLIAAFNVIGSLSMLIIDKQSDIALLRSMGASFKTIRQIFLFEGWAITIIGTLVGIVLGTLLTLAQQEFGLIRLAASGGAYLVNAYPVKLEGIDVLITAVTVILMGFLVAYYPVRYIFKNYIKSE